MSFYFNAKYGLFTYAQCGDLDPFDVVCLFSEVGAECIIGREEHQDGGTHLHAFAAWEKSSDHAVLISLMLEDSTQMLSHLVVHRRVVTTMLQRMVTLSEGDLSDQMEAKFLALAMHGLRSSTRRVEMSFGDLFRNWLLEVLPAISTLSKLLEWKYREDPAPYEHPADIGFNTGNFPELDEWVQHNLERHSRGGE